MTTTSRPRCLGILVLLLFLCSWSPASEAAPEGAARAGSAPGVADDANAGVRDGGPVESGTQAAEGSHEKPVYAPPRRGRPRARVGGGVRSSGPKLPTLKALVPDHVAHTARSQPTLLWFVSDVPPPEAAVMFSLTNEDEIDPLIRAEIERPTKPGVQRIDLSDFDFSLETGKEYEWSVAIVPDPESRARDLVTLGWIERVDAVALGWIERVDGPKGLSKGAADAAALAAAGLWYDAVEVADQAQRAALLDQVGLPSSEIR